MKSTLLHLLLITCLGFVSCVSTKNFLRNDQIPDDFGKGNKKILIIPSTNNKVNKAVEAAFEKYYKGSYEMGGGSKSKTKTNTVLGFTFNIYSSFTPGGFRAGGHEAASTSYYFGVTDLKTNKEYKNIRYGNYVKFARLYVQALEIVRKRNE
jgi:hypothetical protein